MGKLCLKESYFVVICAIYYRDSYICNKSFPATSLYSRFILSKVIWFAELSMAPRIPLFKEQLFTKHKIGFTISTLRTFYYLSSEDGYPQNVHRCHRIFEMASVFVGKGYCTRIPLGPFTGHSILGIKYPWHWVSTIFSFAKERRELFNYAMGI